MVSTNRIYLSKSLSRGVKILKSILDMIISLQTYIASLLSAGRAVSEVPKFGLSREVAPTALVFQERWTKSQKGTDTVLQLMSVKGAFCKN